MFLTSPPSRTVYTGDGIAWIAQADLPPTHAVVTSLPDVSELSPMSLDAWRGWFTSTARLVCERVADHSVAIFFQTDIKRDGAWIDKGYLVMKAAEAAGSAVLWHKVVCRAAPGTVTFGRPAYAHMICVSRALRLPPAASSADVLPELGAMPWVRAMGQAACVAAATFLQRHTACTTVVDPFCGVGTMLAVANAMGMDAVGVELSRRRAEAARTLTVAPTC